MEKGMHLETGPETLAVGVSVEDLKRLDHVRVLRQLVKKPLSRIQKHFQHQQNLVPLVGLKISQSSRTDSPYSDSSE